ncbi:MAG: hypothetical protein FD126_658 [Elusimicrobia bacterium]|nr:MAG: hypothetical protein FD126_658 [Elusimicrobiota bacterium]
MAVLLTGAAGCPQIHRAGTAKGGKAGPKDAAPKPAARPVDPEAQKRAYSRAMKLFTEESYTEAKKAFTEVVRLGPDTELGQKARANLKKVDQMLQSLRELEGK